MRSLLSLFIMLYSLEISAAGDPLTTDPVPPVSWSRIQLTELILGWLQNDCR